MAAFVVESKAGDSARILLADKLIPLCDLDEKRSATLPLVIKRGEVDLQEIKSKLEELDEQWEDTKGQNVALRRAGHDRWGVNKIVLVFSDDFLSRVFVLPFFEVWKPVLQPIFDALGIHADQVIRCLFARMQPGIVIPIHHDSGEWVSRCHRIHVPITTNDGVRFMVGVTADDMTRVVFPEGDIIELNNRSKHSVSNSGQLPRVHLIFDYVDETPDEEPQPPVTRIALKAGAQLVQTRRSIDITGAPRVHPIPSFVVLGAQKAGTTSLHDWLVAHPLVLRARRKETHYFDWRWNNDLTTVEQHKAEYQKYFACEHLDVYPSLMTGEATPSYLMGGSQLIARAASLLDTAQVKLLVVLRDPVDRAYSHYQMTADLNGSPAQLKNRGHSELQGATFEQVVERELAELEQLGVHPDMTAEEFDAVFLTSRRAFTHGGHSHIARGLYALQLELWLQQWPRPDNIRVLRMAELREGGPAQSTMDSLLPFLGLPRVTLQPRDLAAKNTRSYPPLDMQGALATRLRDFFRPYNRRLELLLGWDDCGWP